jgi:N-acetyl-gamma-glutamyl-phosphate reductase
MRDPAVYPKHYAFEHREPKLLERAVYGLPELNRARLAAADLIAVPGCYPTSIILPLRPLVKAGAVRAGTRPIIDATSGVSGAGRGLSLRSLFCEVSQSPYGVLKHRHNPEIDEHAGLKTLFTPHLGPFDRGILSTIHVDLADGFASAAKIRELIENAYGDEPFVRVLPEGAFPAVNDVAGTNFCDIGIAVDQANAHAILFGAIDNLVKGAAGQAVQCLNVRFGLPETTGLLPGAAT